MPAILEQIIDPVIAVTDTTIQVGQPGFPTGAAITFEIEVEKTKWTKKWFRGWKPSITIGTKKIRYQLDDKALEKLLEDWKTGVIDYEAWLLIIKQKAKQHFDELEEE